MVNPLNSARQRGRAFALAKGYETGKVDRAGARASASEQDITHVIKAVFDGQKGKFTPKNWGG